MSGDLEIVRDGGTVVVRLRGDVDMAGIPAISAHVLDALTMDAHGLVVDLSEVRYIDSAGVHMLFDFARRLESGRQAMVIAVGPGSPLRKLLQITNVDQVVAVRETYDEAVAAVGDGARRSY